MEMLPKETKRQREERVQSYGQATIDLVEFVRGRTDLLTRLTVHPTPGSTLEAQMPAIAAAAAQSGDPSASMSLEIEAKISVDQPLLLDDEIAKTNLMTISLESMYALPDSWTSTTASKDFAYSIALPVPVNEDVS